MQQRSKWWSFIAGGVLGTVVGAGAMLIAYPYAFPPPAAADAAPLAQADAGRHRPSASTTRRRAATRCIGPTAPAG